MAQTSEQRIEAALERIRVLRHLTVLRGWAGATAETAEAEIRNGFGGGTILHKAFVYVRNGKSLLDYGEKHRITGDSRYVELLEAAAPACERAAALSETEYAALLPEEGERQ